MLNDPCGESNNRVFEQCNLVRVSEKNLTEHDATLQLSGGGVPPCQATTPPIAQRYPPVRSATLKSWYSA